MIARGGNSALFRLPTPRFNNRTRLDSTSPRCDLQTDGHPTRDIGERKFAAHPLITTPVPTQWRHSPNTIEMPLPLTRGILWQRFHKFDRSTWAAAA